MENKDNLNEYKVSPDEIMKKKPIYKNVWFWLVILFIGLPVLTALINLATGKKIATDEVAKKDEVVEVEKSPADLRIDGIARQKRELEEGLNRATKYSTEEIKIFETVLDNYEILEKMIKQYQNATYLDEPEIKKMYDEFEVKLKKACEYNFPKLREQYFKNVEHGLWKQNIEVQIRGKKKDTFTLISGLFFDNNNKEELYKGSREIMYKLRFKKFETLRYKSDREYTLYNVKSLEDNELTLKY